MNLSEVRELKSELWHAVGIDIYDGAHGDASADFPGFGFAFGARLTETEDVYRFAIRVPSQEAWSRLFQSRARPILQRREKDLDVQVTGPVRFNTAAAPSHLGPPNAALRIGASVRHAAGAAGTLGFFAKREERMGIVSCNHVLARLDQGHDRDPIIGPSGVPLALVDGYPRLTDATVPVKLADCAFAEFVNGDVPEDPAALEGAERLQRSPVVLTKEMPVKKIGAVSGVTTGTVVVRDLDCLPLSVGDNLTAVFNDVIEIQSDNPHRRFSRNGDSGSLVYSLDLCPIGLLFADTAIGGQHNKGLSFLNSFDHVVGALGVSLVV